MRHLALGAACLALLGCGSTESGTPVGVGAKTTPATSDETTAGDSTAGKPTATKKASGGFKPSDKDKDPTNRIDGVTEQKYVAGQHVRTPQRVAYDHTPPLGGAHDAVWAACNGVVYAKAVRTEHLVHSLEHGAVWITYDPDKVRGAAVRTLAAKVDGEPYTVMSPYPGQPKPVSVQSWGKQLQVDGVDDARIDQFVQATRANPYLTPEPGASCDSTTFDQDDPPPFDPSPPGPDAVPPTGR
ncbi:hypothetical protein Acsp05_27260 [Actinokineospora sp. NBRC 105648]|nr:hypothetical protein Acsp05_27260 [Actinokineospora sp. NBRC 105648]